MKITSSLFLLIGMLLMQGATVNAANSSQTVQLSNSTNIPGGTLPAGTYSFAVEDRLKDRGIVRITDNGSSKHYLLLVVSTSASLPADSDGVSYFTSAKDGSQSLRAWKCPSCASALEFAYPKLEAVKITGESAQPVLAVDPEYDKLPPNLSEDDMKVVTLWLLSPKRIVNNQGDGVNAEKYADARQHRSNQPVAATAPATPPPTETASADVAPASPASAAGPRRHLPKTASDTFNFALCGLILLAGAAAFRVRRVGRS